MKRVLTFALVALVLGGSTMVYVNAQQPVTFESRWNYAISELDRVNGTAGLHEVSFDRTVN